MKFGQLIESNIGNIFTQNVVDKLVPDPFLKNLNWAYLVLFAKLRAIEIYWN